MFSGIDTKVSADFTLTLCKVIHWLCALQTSYGRNGMQHWDAQDNGFGVGGGIQDAANLANRNSGFGGFDDCNASSLTMNNGFIDSLSDHHYRNNNNAFGAIGSTTTIGNDDDDMTPEFSQSTSSSFEFAAPTSAAFGVIQEAGHHPCLYSTLLSAFMAELAGQCVIHKNVDPRLVIEHFQCRGLIHVDGTSGCLEYHLYGVASFSLVFIFLLLFFLLFFCFFVFVTCIVCLFSVASSSHFLVLRCHPSPATTWHSHPKNMRPVTRAADEYGLQIAVGRAEITNIGPSTLCEEDNK
jgi:hypothetical protein